MKLAQSLSFGTWFVESFARPQIGAASGSTLLEPAPDNETTAGEFVALLVMETLPVTLPADSGANVTVKIAVSPGTRARPKGSPPAPKTGPETMTSEIVTSESPELVNRTVCVARDRRTPGSGSSQVLGAVVGVMPGGRELLRESLGNRRIRRTHADRLQHRSGDRQHRRVRGDSILGRGEVGRASCYGCGQTAAADRGYACDRRPPSSRSSQILGAVVGVVAGGGELLLVP